MFIDTHCHLSRKDYSDIDSIIIDNRNANIDKIVISSSTPDDIEETLEFSMKYLDVYASIGYHPESVSCLEELNFIFLESHLMDEKVVAIGEIGLDYHYDKDNKLKQQEIFRRQLDLAKKYHLPVIIHSRDATNDTINILKDYQLTGIIHCFSGSYESAIEYIKMGYYLGIGGVVTFKNSRLFEVIEKIPLDHIVLETDSPYLSPDPFRGKQNSSKNIPIIATKIANIKNVSLEEVEKITTGNASRLFDFH